jgi:hypothetical protein
MSTMMFELTNNEHSRGLTINNVAELCEFRYLKKKHFVEGWEKMNVYPCIIMREINLQQMVLTQAMNAYKYTCREYIQNMRHNYEQLQLSLTFNTDFVERMMSQIDEIQNRSFYFYSKTRRFHLPFDPEWKCIVKPIFWNDIVYFNEYLQDMLNFLDRMRRFSRLLYEEEMEIQDYPEEYTFISDNESESEEEKEKPTLSIIEDTTIDMTQMYDCAICLNETIPIVNIGILQCKHAFCLECLHSAFQSDTSYHTHYRCCLCRNNILQVICSKENKNIIQEFCL